MKRRESERAKETVHIDAVKETAQMKDVLATENRRCSGRFGRMAEGGGKVTTVHEIPW